MTNRGRWLPEGCHEIEEFHHPGIGMANGDRERRELFRLPREEGLWGQVFDVPWFGGIRLERLPAQRQNIRESMSRKSCRGSLNRDSPENTE